MGQSIEALVTPGVLKWARESAGYSLEAVAKKLAVPPERVLSWEEGVERPSVARARRMAAVYRRPFALFFAPAPPREEELAQQYRRLAGSSPAPLSPELRLLIRDAHSKREAALESADLLQEEIPRFLHLEHVDAGPASLPDALRSHLGVSLEVQTAWANAYEGLKGWISAAESRGVLVLQSSIESLHEMRGFALYESVLPVVVLNGRDSPRGRIFTLFHELAHLALGRSSIYRFEGAAPDPTEPVNPKEVETLCDHLAAAALMPESAVRTHPNIQGKTSEHRWTRPEIQSLANDFQVSQEAMLRRLVSLQVVSPDYYWRMRGEYLREYAAQSARAEGKEVRILRATLVLRDNGRLFTGLVFDAFYRDLITLSDVADYLNSKVKHLGRVEAALR